MDFKKKTVFITGASSGIGEALAYEYAGNSVNLVLIARRMERIEQIQKRIEEAGGQALAIPGDVNVPQDLERAVRDAVDRFGGLDIVIANAGFGVIGQFQALKVADYRTQFETNVFGVLNTVVATLPELKKSKGWLAIMGSVMSYVSLPGQ